MAKKEDLGGRILGLLGEEGNKQRSIRYMAEELDVSGPGVMYAAEKLKKAGALMYWKDGDEWAMRLPTGGHTLPDDSSILDVKDLERCQNLVKKHFATISEQNTKINDLEVKLTEVLEFGEGVERDEKIGKLRLGLGESKLVISSLESKVGELEDTLTLKDENLMELESQLEQRSGDSLDAVSVRGTLKNQEEELKLLRNTVIEHVRTIDGQENHIKELKAQVNGFIDQENYIQKQVGVINDREKTIAELTAELKDKPVDSFVVKDVRGQQWQDKVAELRCNLNESDSVVSRQRERIRDYEATIREFLARGAVVDSEALFLRGVVDRLLPERKRE